MSRLTPDILSEGIQTAKKLKKLGVESPSTENAIWLDHKTKVVPNKPIKGKKELQKYIEMKRKQLNIRQ